MMTPFAYILMMVGLVFVIYLVIRFFERKKMQTFFRIAQIVQLVFLYGWYWAIQEPLSESLPLYHCRIAMFAVLLLPDKVPYKQYFALLGVFGPICAIVYPILDPYPFPHVTLFSFFIGHFALLGNSIIYPHPICFFSLMPPLHEPHPGAYGWMTDGEKLRNNFRIS